MENIAVKDAMEKVRVCACCWTHKTPTHPLPGHLCQAPRWSLSAPSPPPHTHTHTHHKHFLDPPFTHTANIIVSSPLPGHLFQTPACGAAEHPTGGCAAQDSPAAVFGARVWRRARERCRLAHADWQRAGGCRVRQACGASAVDAVRVTRCGVWVGRCGAGRREALEFYKRVVLMLLMLFALEKVGQGVWGEGV
eukprot:26269-Chlamydomonas_euryale.AAC.1